MTTEQRQNAGDAYIEAHGACVGLIERIETLLSDMAAPDDDARPVTWCHVDTANEIERRLTQVVAFLEETER